MIFKNFKLFISPVAAPVLSQEKGKGKGKGKKKEAQGELQQWKSLGFSSQKQMEVAMDTFQTNGGTIVKDVAEADGILASQAFLATLKKDEEGDEKRRKPKVLSSDFIMNSILEGKLVLPESSAAAAGGKRKADSPPPLAHASSETSSTTNIGTSPFKKGKKGTQRRLDCFHPLTGELIKGDNAEENKMKDLIIQELGKLLRRYIITGDDIRIVSYRRAIASIKVFQGPLKSAKDAKKLSGIGDKTAKKIEEIIQTGKLRQNEEITPEQNLCLDTLELFMKLYNVGPKKAREWFDAGLRTMDDVRKVKNLNKGTEIYLQYFDDLEKRISREHIEEIGRRVEKEAHSIDPNCVVVLMGSYRRGRKDSSDVDFLIYPNSDGEELSKAFVHSLIERLKEKQIVLETLKIADTMFNGICRLPNGTAGRLDFLACTYKERGAALLHFTGNELYNRSIRELANQRGLSLSQHGLILEERDKNGKLLKETVIASETEEEILNYLGVPYLTPEQRNFG